MTEQTKEQITAIALANGFKLKAQPDGSMALNPYVFDFAHAVAASTQPPQQSAQPVAWIEHHKGGDNLNWEQSGKSDTPLYAAAQPVEVQRVPLTDEQVEDMRGEANRSYDIGFDEYFKAFRDAERAHGIKPASEGGAA